MTGSKLLTRLGLIVALLALGGTAFTQDHAPMAGSTTEVLGTFAPSQGNGHALVFMRLTMEPGVTIPAHHHPGAVIVVVQSGLFGTKFVQGDGTIVRFANGTTEVVDAGAEATLDPGDSLSYEGAMHTMRNDGPDPLILLVSALLDPNQPGFLFQEGTTH